MLHLLQTYKSECKKKTNTAESFLTFHAKNILNCQLKGTTQQEICGVMQSDWVRITNTSPPGGCGLVKDHRMMIDTGNRSCEGALKPESSNLWWDQTPLHCMSHGQLFPCGIIEFTGYEWMIYSSPWHSTAVTRLMWMTCNTHMNSWIWIIINKVLIHSECKNASQYKTMTDRKNTW